VWTRQWTIYTYTAEELAANKTRQAELQNPQENNQWTVFTAINQS